MKHLVGMLILLALVAGCATFKPSQGPVLMLEHAHLGGATVVAFSPSGEWLASGGHDGSVAVWHVPDGKRLMKTRMHHRAVRGLVWRDSQTIISAAEDGRIAVWSVQSGTALHEVQVAPVTAMVYDRVHDRLLTGHPDGALRVFDSQNLDERGQSQAGAFITALAYASKSNVLAAATHDDQVLLFDHKFNVVDTLHAPREVKGLAFSPDGRRLAGGAWFALLVWDLRSGKLSIRDTEHFGAIIAMAYTPDGRALATIGRYTDGGVRLIDANDNHVLRRLSAHNACGWAIRVSPSGRYLATASEDESIRLYDLHERYEPRFQNEP